MKFVEKTTSNADYTSRLYRGLFGLILIEYTLEDRRPDLSEEEAAVQLGYKYKSTILVRIFKTEFFFTCRSIRPSMFTVVNNR